jgi:hypothetical protein
MIQSVFHRDSGLLYGLAGFVAPAVSVIVGLSFARVRPRRAMRIGIYASVIGAAGIIGGAAAGSLAIMFLGQAVAGSDSVRRSPPRTAAPQLSEERR